jgi:uncharacterized membrane protein YeaQ/YmgE (transglycosylase-associated protein family)
MPLWAQVMFFGALLSAILSTASGALLAPTALFTENVLRPFAPHMGDKQLLLTLRIILVTFTAGALLFALNSKSTMYEMVQNAYNVTLAGAFVPLVAGAYWKRANTQGALLSIVLGIGTWLAAANAGGARSHGAANLLGLFASIIGMLLGSLAPSTVIAARASRSRQPAPCHAPHGQRGHGGSTDDTAGQGRVAPGVAERRGRLTYNGGFLQALPCRSTPTAAPPAATRRTCCRSCPTPVLTTCPACGAPPSPSR